MKSVIYVLGLLLTVALCLVTAEIVQLRGLDSVETSDAINQKLNTASAYGGKKGGGYGGKKGGYDIRDCCTCDCPDGDSNFGKKGGYAGGCICDCDDCGDDDDDDDDDDESSPVTAPIFQPDNDDDDDDDDDDDSPVLPYGGKKNGYIPSCGGKKGGKGGGKKVGYICDDDDDDDDDDDEPTPICKICGEDMSMSISNPDGVVEFPGQSAITCEQLQAEGNVGLIPTGQCDRLPELVNRVCGCNPPCSVCGDGKEVDFPDAIVEFPGQFPIECGVLQSLGLSGRIQADQCDALPDLIDSVCGCDPRTPDPTPEPTRPPTPGPTRPPTPGPTRPPTPGPTRPPTPEPTRPPTPEPTRPPTPEPNRPPTPGPTRPPTPGPTRPPTPEPTRPPTPEPTSSPTNPDCDICGENMSMSIGIPDGIVEFPGQPAITCEQLQAEGAAGFIPSSTCDRLPAIVNRVCGCNPPCSVCGDGKEVDFPDAIVEFPGQPPIECGLLQTLGYVGSLPDGQCKRLPDLIDEACGCDPPTPGPTPNPTKPPTPEPTPPPTPNPTFPPTPSPTNPQCDICGEDMSMSIGIPNGIVEFPGQPAITCEELQADGTAGLIPSRTCDRLPALVNSVCGCNPPCSVCGDGKEVDFPMAVVSFPGQPVIKCGDLQTNGYVGIIPASQCERLSDLIDDVCGCDPRTPEPTRNPTRPPTPNPTRPPTPSPVCIPTGKKGGYGGKKGGNGCEIGYGKKGGYGGKKGGYGGKKGGYGYGYNSGYTLDDDEDCCVCGFTGAGKKGGRFYECDCSACGDDDDNDDDDGDDDDDDDNDDDDDDDDGKGQRL